MYKKVVMWITHIGCCALPSEVSETQVNVCFRTNDGVKGYIPRCLPRKRSNSYQRTAFVSRACSRVNVICLGRQGKGFRDLIYFKRCGSIFWYGNKVFFIKGKYRQKPRGRGRRHGFLKRMNTADGQNVIKNRRRVGRKHLTMV